MFFVLSGFIITTMLWRLPARRLGRRRVVGVRPPPGGAALPRAARPRRRRDRAVRRRSRERRSARGEVARRGAARARARPRRSGPPRSTAASGCRRCSPSGRPGRWRSSGTSTCSGRSSSSPPEAAAWRPGALAVGSLVAAAVALRSSPAAGRLLVLLRPLGAVRRAARGRRARAVAPGRRRADAARCGAAAPARPPSRWRSSASITVLGPARAQPALPLGRRAARGAGDRGPHPRRLRQPPAARSTGCSSHPWLAAVGRRSYSLYLWHLVPLLLLEQADLASAQAGARPPRGGGDGRADRRQLPVPGAAVPAATQRRAAAGSCHGTRLGPVRRQALSPGPDALERREQVVGGAAGRVQPDLARRPRPVAAAPSDRGVEVGEELLEGRSSAPTSSPGTQSRTSGGSSGRV